MATSVTPNRDSVTTIRDDGSRRFLHPSDSRGILTVARRWVAAFLIILYIALPWIQINGNPAVFLNIFEQRFHLFGMTFAAQDMWLAYFLISGLAFALFYVTALFGRVWCGWACPQTVFLEHVYRRIERFIEGDAPARRKLDRADWNGSKLFKRVLKHSIFLLLSALIVHIFIAYFISVPELYSWVTQSPAEHWPTFVFMIIATGLLYGNFAWFREQLCIVICPYGRLQSALIDDHTVNIAYDEKRGEPRGKASDPNAGDCIDCHRCIQVCPTGIDIRQGLQLECVGCTACIDACDEIMDKLNRKRGLIRFASESQLEGKKLKLVRPRTILYSVLAIIGLSVATFSFSNVKPFHASITRMVGSPSYLTDTQVRNQFQLRLINKEREPASFTVTVQADAPGFSTAGFTEAITVPPFGEQVSPLIMIQDRAQYNGPFPTSISVQADSGRNPIEMEVKFVGPDPRLLNDE